MIPFYYSRCLNVISFLKWTISLAQNNNDANHYYIGVYDNNFPGEKRYIEMTCTKKSCVTKANDNYNSSEQPIFISASLEEDLKYFQ